MKSSAVLRREVERMCVVCRQQLPQRQLIRLAFGQAGVAVDPTNKGPGRGAYLCTARICWSARERDKRLAAALKTRLSTLDAQRLDGWAKAHDAELTPPLAAVPQFP